MSIDKSLVSKTSLSRRRNVLRRGERLKRLIEEGKWKEGDSVFGFPKVKVKVITKKKGKSKAKAAEAEAGAAAEGAAAEQGTAAEQRGASATGAPPPKDAAGK